MKLHVLAVGHKMPDWIASGFAEYTKRMPPELRIEGVGDLSITKPASS